ncbi:transporter, auxin efflux carrier (AEC) family protein [Entamoeba nuttalli P19]|uniref:Transporter, auxin efflux carrier (AEC) family protein n=1 Tax=Entamoeba nuttalli (strain P19) TaxID=1076696 RepID=K2I0I9_ENTNP|nr:transporter, auxin efflux carrier (AEC) family protein [Entamoeba nuttalli P19]EKE42270.1 transporter, auxin efflux carrier (AEC) family protein [Entamoeba nuttalli P19]|eukprot:XP_008855393.1 transporter, auxin efflux carrier (AEC) family protein [Entamoeba nuttalli P19]
MIEFYEQFGTLVFIITASFIIKIIWFRGIVRESSGLLMKIMFNLTFPFVILKALINTHSLDIESLAMFISGFIFQISIGLISFIIFKFIIKNDIAWQVEFGGCIGLNIGLFLFPILETLDPVNGITHAILFNISNDVACYLVLRPLFALIENSKEDDEKQNEITDIQVELKESQIIENELKGDERKSLDNDSFDIKGTPTLESSIIASPSEESIMRTSLDLYPNKPTDFIKYGQKKTLRNEKQKWHEIIKKIIISLITCVPLYVMPIGYYIGLNNIKLPRFINNIIITISSGNTLMAYNLLGLFFEWKNSWQTTKLALQALIVRLIVGISIGVGLYFALSSYITQLTRLTITLCCVCPAPLLSIIYSVEYNVTRLDVSAAIVSFSVVTSFITVFILTTLLSSY